MSINYAAVEISFAIVLQRERFVGENSISLKYVRRFWEVKRKIFHE